MGGLLDVLRWTMADLAATDFAAASSPEGRAWMAALPSLLHDLAPPTQALSHRGWETGHQGTAPLTISDNYRVPAHRWAGTR